MDMNVSRDRGKDTSMFQRGRVIGLHEAKKTTKEISETTGINLRTVQRIIKEWKDSGECSSSRDNCGRKKILSDRDRRSLKRLVKKNRKKSTLQITTMFNAGVKTVSARTMRRELKGLGLNSCTATRKPLVSQMNRRKRLQFAKAHKNWTVEDWKRVMWSDESRFTLFQSDGRIRVRREPHEAMDPSCMVPTVQASGGSVMLWGCFTWSGLGSATLCSNKMKSQDYLNVLNDLVIPSMQFFFPQNTGSFQDDNAKIHRANCVKDWFTEFSDMFLHMDWPPQSPDLNPIEWLWDVLEKSLRSSPNLPTSLAELGDTLLKKWTGITVDTLHNLVETMPRRMRAVIKAKGGPTKY